ncbi:MAG: RDD family protein [Ferruginibacter sp.]
MEYQQTENTQNASSNLLGDEAALINEYEYASTGQRFLNFLIDNLVMNYGLSYLTGYAVGITITVLNPDFYVEKGSASFYLLIYMISILDYLLYYILSEKLFNGYTLGKLITGTKAIREDGDQLTLKDVLIRTVCRLVPFETLSGFKIRPWHDEWSKTMVVKSR